MPVFNLGNNEAATGLDGNDVFNQNGTNTTALGGAGNDTFNINGNSAQSYGGDDVDKFVLNNATNVSMNGGAGDDVMQYNFLGFQTYTFNGADGRDWLDNRLETAATTYNFAGSTSTAANGTLTNAFVTGTLIGVENIVGSNTAGDSFIGGAFNMRFDGYGGNDTAVGGSGNETFLGGAGNDNLSGGNGNDLLTGGTWNAAGIYDGGATNVGTNTLDGGNGNDAMIASNAGDLIIVGDGQLDYVRLGLGNDTVVADGTSDFVSIQAFTAHSTAVPGNDADVLKLLTSTGIDTFDELLSHSTDFTGSGGVFGTVIKTDNGGTIYLDGVKKSSLAATDFIFG